MKIAKGISAILRFLLVEPMKVYLCYKVMQAINASDLMWFFFWAILPITFLIGAIQGVIERLEK